MSNAPGARMSASHQRTVMNLAMLGPHLRPRSTGRKLWRWTQIGFAQLSTVRTAGLSIPSTAPKRAFRAASPFLQKLPTKRLGAGDSVDDHTRHRWVVGCAKSRAKISLRASTAGSILRTRSGAEIDHSPNPPCNWPRSPPQSAGNKPFFTYP